MTTKNKFQSQIESLMEEHKEALDMLAMDDITFCNNSTCPLRKNCYRSLDNLKKNPGKYLSVSHFEIKEDGQCDFFWPLKEKT